MSPETDKAKLTAYALGELAEAERAEIDGLLVADPHARAHVEQVQETAALLEREFAAQTEQRLLPVQRERLRRAAQRPQQRPAWSGRTWTITGLAGLAAAASFAIFIMPLLQTARSSRHALAPVAPAAADFNADGSVNIVDAYLLARALESTESQVAPRWDLTADGVIDQADVDAIARFAVELKETS